MGVPLRLSLFESIATRTDLAYSSVLPSRRLAGLA